MYTGHSTKHCQSTEISCAWVKTLTKGFGGDDEQSVKRRLDENKKISKGLIEVLEQEWQHTVRKNKRPIAFLKAVSDFYSGDMSVTFTSA